MKILLWTEKNVTQRGVWRQVGRCLVGDFTGILGVLHLPEPLQNPTRRQAPDTECVL